MSLYKEICEESLKLIDGNGKWEGNIVLECCEGWHKDRTVSNHKSLPCIVVG